MGYATKLNKSEIITRLKHHNKMHKRKAETKKPKVVEIQIDDLFKAEQLKLRKFTADLPVKHTWHMERIENKIYFSLKAEKEESAVSLWIIAHYFNAIELTCRLDNQNSVVIDCEIFEDKEMNTELPKRLTESAKQTLKGLLALPDILLSTVCGVIKHGDWSVTSQGLTSVIMNTKKLDRDIFALKCHNAALFLNYLFHQCEVFDKSVELKECKDHFELSIPFQLLSLDALQKLVCDKELLKSCRSHVSVVSTQTTKMTSIDDLKTRIEAELEKKALEKAAKALVEQHQKEREEAHQRETQKQRIQLEKESKNKEKSREKKKPIKRQHEKKPTPLTTTSSQKHKKNTKKAATSGIPPQSIDRQKPLPITKPARYDNIIADPGTEDYQRIEEELEQHQEEMHRKFLALEIRQQEPIFHQISTLVEHLDQVISEFHNDVETNQNVMLYVAAWHYIHGQLCNLLSFLSENHPAKHILSCALLDQDRRFYDKQKHCYFPNVCPSDSHEACFANLDHLRKILTVILEQKEPTPQEIEEAKHVVEKEWAHYLESQYNRYDLSELTKSSSTPTEFRKWVSDKIRLYREKCESLYKMEPATPQQKFCRDCAIYFYLWRIGELVGHIPHTERNHFEKQCRIFRNKVSHTFENNTLNELPTLDLVQLFKANSSINYNGSLFGSSDKENKARLIVNSRYAYRNNKNDDVRMLTQCRLREAGLIKQARICQSIALEANGNLFKQIKDDITLMQQSSDQDFVLLIPTELKGTDRAISYPLALHFQKGELKEISYSILSHEHAPQIKAHLEFLQKNWCSQSPHKNQPSLKYIENNLLPHMTEFDQGVSQVECLFRLAERKLKNGMIRPYPKASKATPLIKTLREEHLNLAWKANRHDFYFNQVTKKIVFQSDLDLSEAPKHRGHLHATNIAYYL